MRLPDDLVICVLDFLQYPALLAVNARWSALCAGLFWDATRPRKALQDARTARFMHPCVSTPRVDTPARESPAALQSGSCAGPVPVQ